MERVTEATLLREFHHEEVAIVRPTHSRFLWQVIGGMQLVMAASDRAVVGRPLYVFCWYVSARPTMFCHECVAYCSLARFSDFRQLYSILDEPVLQHASTLHSEQIDR